MHLFSKNIVESPLCVCGTLEDTNHFLFNCGRFHNLRQEYGVPLGSKVCIFSGTKNNFSGTKNNISGTKNNFSGTKNNFSPTKIIFSPTNIIFSATKIIFSPTKINFSPTKNTDF